MTKAPPSNPPPNATLSAGKRRLFFVVMGLVPVLFFVLMEVVLRLVGYGATYPLFVPVPQYEAYRYQNRDVARRYFFNQDRVPTGLSDVFKAEKDSNAFRIFVQGGSSAAGYPYYYGGSFSRMLEQRLQQTFSGRSIEVVNTALAAVNSYTMLDFADEIIAEEPDAVLIYAGHNEFYGALGVGSAESLGQYRGMVTLYLQLQELRLVQGLRALIGKGALLLGGRQRGERPANTLMERMAREQTITLGSPLYQRGLNQFRGNLRALLARYQGAGIPTLVGTVASNERTHKPFISTLAPRVDEATWRQQYEAGVQAAQRGDSEGALEAIDAAIALDSLAADAFYARAQILDQAGQHEAARTAYLAAKDRDQLRFRAPEQVNTIIREEAARVGAIVVDTQKALAEAAEDGIIGSDLMLEHLHPNTDGYFVLADAFYHALQQADLIGAWRGYVPTGLARQEVLFTAVDSLYGAYRLRQLMGAWPFQPAGTVDRSMDTVQARTRIEELALALYRRESNWHDATAALRDHYKEHGDYHRALLAGLAMIQQYPFLPGPYAEAGDILVRQNRLDEALVYFEVANEQEASAGVHYMMGAIYLAKQKATEAAQHLEQALALEPNHPQALFQLSRAYMQQNRRDDALSMARRLLEVAPDYPQARQLLAALSSSPDS